MFERASIPVQEKPKEKFPNIDAEASGYMEKFDFEELRDVFSEFLEDLGLNSENNIKQLIIDAENFKKESGATKHGLAAKNLLKSDIIINWSECRKIFESSDKIVSDAEIREQFREQFLFKLICHEETHSMAAHENTISPKGLLGAEGYLKTGYSKLDVNVRAILIVRVNQFHVALNEAITEIIGSRIFEEYMKRKGESVLPLVRNDTFDRRYLNEMSMLGGIIGNICKEAGIEKDVLLKIIFRGYFAGEDLSGERMGRLFENIFPTDFEKKLANWKGGNSNNKEKDEIYIMLNQAKWTDDDRKRVRRWVMSVYHTMPNSKEK